MDFYHVKVIGMMDGWVDGGMIVMIETFALIKTSLGRFSFTLPLTCVVVSVRGLRFSWIIPKVYKR